MEQNNKKQFLGKKSRKWHFNLVEVALSIGIVGIGMAGIMALYPVALKAAKNSIGNNYSILAGDQFLSYLQAQCENDWNFARATVQSLRPTILDSNTNTSGWSNKFGNIYTSGTGLTAGAVYGIRMGSGKTTDFSAHALLWKSPVTSTVFNGTTAVEFTDNHYENAAVLNIEMSWPAEIPYSKRSKRIYSIIVSRKL